MELDSGARSSSGHADESKARCLSVLTCNAPSDLLGLLTAHPPGTGLPTLGRVTFLQRLLSSVPGSSPPALPHCLLLTAPRFSQKAAVLQPGQSK